MKKIALAATLALATAVAPATAKDHPVKAQQAKAKSHVSDSHGDRARARKCQAHGTAFVVGGTLDSGSLTKNDDGTYSGTLTVTVKRANHQAQAEKGTSKAYTLDHAKANLHGADPAALVAGSRVQLLGKLTRLAKRCDQTGFTATTTIKRANIKAPKAAEAPSTTETPAAGETPAPAPTA